VAPPADRLWSSPELSASHGQDGGGGGPPANYDGWDFRPGRRFESEFVHRFGTLVHHPCSAPIGSFFLLAVCHRSSFWLTEESVGLALHSVLGGSLVVFLLATSNHVIFSFLLPPRRLAS
jgi:hypothetical protein